MIANAASDLLEMIEQFQAEHTPGSLARELGRAGVVSTGDGYAAGLARHVLSDFAGLAWCLESAVAFVTSQLLEEPPADLREGTHHG